MNLASAFITRWWLTHSWYVNSPLVFLVEINLLDFCDANSHLDVSLWVKTGILIALWAVPRMTGSRFLLAAISTTYILLSVKYLEEPQIKDMMGDEYTDYLRRVPRYIPFMKPAIAPDDNDIEPEYAIGESPSSSSLSATMSAPLKRSKLASFGTIPV